jgi:hypothetical protein
MEELRTPECMLLSLTVGAMERLVYDQPYRALVLNQGNRDYRYQHRGG